MAIALLTHAFANGSSSAAAVATLDSTSAKLFIVAIGAPDLTGITLVDGNSNTWNPLTGKFSFNANGASILYWSNPTVVGAGNTFTAEHPSHKCSISVACFSGADTVSPFDQQNGANPNIGSGTTMQTGSVTPTQDGELVIYSLGGIFSTPLSVDIGTLLDSGGVSSGNFYGDSLAYEIQTTATTRNPTFTFVNFAGFSPAATIATFKAASTGDTLMGQACL